MLAFLPTFSPLELSTDSTEPATPNCIANREPNGTKTFRIMVYGNTVWEYDPPHTGRAVPLLDVRLRGEPLCYTPYKFYSREGMWHDGELLQGGEFYFRTPPGEYEVWLYQDEASSSYWKTIEVAPWQDFTTYGDWILDDQE